MYAPLENAFDPSYPALDMPCHPCDFGQNSMVAGLWKTAERYARQQQETANVTSIRPRRSISALLLYRYFSS